MDVTDIIKESLTYPINNLINWLTIAVVFLLIGILKQYILVSEGIGFYLAWISLIIISIITIGLAINIIHNKIHGSNNNIRYNPIINIREGIECIVISIIYSLIPNILTLFIAYITGIYNNFSNIITNAKLSNSSGLNLLTNIPHNSLETLLSSIIITFILGFIFYILTSLILEIAIASFSDTGDLISGLNIGKILKRISHIGWNKYITYYVITSVIVIILILISSIITAIPYVGKVISSFIIDSYLLLFITQSIGSIYLEGY